jgi:putative transcriptional regulator
MERISKGVFMPIIVNLDVMLAKRKMRLNELADLVDLTMSNLSILKTGKAKAIRFSTLEAICEHLQCQPGDILQFEPSDSKDITEE